VSRLREQVRIARRFQRSIRIDTDLGNPAALEGFVCPASSADALLTMARQIAASGHTAFTWTGPYGTGKSSLAVSLCGTMSGPANVRARAANALGKEVAAALWDALPPKTHGWRVLPVMGRRGSLGQILGEALESSGYLGKGKRRWTDSAVLSSLSAVAAQDPRTHGGLIVIVDEMGKVLEGAAHDGYDIYLLQQLAELAARSERRLVVVGVLHQAFDEYAQRLAREVRDEWAKVQGRFVDLVINTTGDEQLELLARAIETGPKPPIPRGTIAAVADIVRAGRPSATERLPELLTRCWPLHPVVACLLGPLSRRRYGQNQRSLFAFLNSAEQRGFHDFLSDASTSDLYTPELLWDYLRINLEPAILASPDGHRWSVGLDAIERCSAQKSSPLHLALLKAIALLELLRERSGLSATSELLEQCVAPEIPRRDVGNALKQLADWSCIVFRRHLGAYSLYAGSDFEIDEAIASATPTADSIDMAQLRTIAGLQPLLAKRHYHKTGAIRWFNVELVRLCDLPDAVASPRGMQGAAGRFLIAVPTQGEAPHKAKKMCSEIAASAPMEVVIGLSAHAWHVIDLARELVALTKIHDERPELRGDAVGRREVMARLGDVRARLELELQRMTDAATWYRRSDKPAQIPASELNLLASRIADERFSEAPRILNELLNRDYPSSNAVTAQKDLLKQMLVGEGKPRLGLEGWPAEAGLMESVLIKTGLYRETGAAGWRFVGPTPKSDPAGLLPLWKAGLEYLKRHSKKSVSLSELYEEWRKPPFGLKEGLMPIIAVALMLAHRDRLAVYRQGTFQPEMTDLDVDLLTSEPSHVHFRWMEISDTGEKILDRLTEVAKALDPTGCAASRRPLDVARALVAAYDRLPPWTKRTMRLSQNAQRVSTLLRYAADPNRLLFDDVPNLVSGKPGKSADAVEASVNLIRDAFKELLDAYPSMLRSLESMMLNELEVRESKSALGELRERASNVQQTSGDLRLNAFVSRLANYAGTRSDIEGIAGLAIEKKPADWVDADIDQARLRIAELAQAFKRHEAFTRVAGRPDKRHRMSVIVPLDGLPRALHSDFDVTDYDRDEIAALIRTVEGALERANETRKNVILAALAELSSRYMQPSTTVGSRPRRKAAV
jgi:hypothetical protein